MNILQDDYGLIEYFDIVGYWYIIGIKWLWFYVYYFFYFNMNCVYRDSDVMGSQ